VEKTAASESAVTLLLTFLIIIFMYLFYLGVKSKAEDIRWWRDDED
jgi:cell division protein FtsB